MFYLAQRPPSEGQWCGALVFFLLWAWTTQWINDRFANNLRHYDAHETLCDCWGNHPRILKEPLKCYLIYAILLCSIYSSRAESFSNVILAFPQNWCMARIWKYIHGLCFPVGWTDWSQIVNYLERFMSHYCENMSFLQIKWCCHQIVLKLII